MVTGARFQGSLCKTREEAAESAAGVALLQMVTLSYIGRVLLSAIPQILAFADDNLNVNEELKFGLGRAENIVGKGENAGHQRF